MLWVYGLCKCFYIISAGIDYRRQILTYKVDPRAVRVSSLLVLSVFAWYLIVGLLMMEYLNYQIYSLEIWADQATWTLI